MCLLSSCFGAIKDRWIDTIVVTKNKWRRGVLVMRADS